MSNDGRRALDAWEIGMGRERTDAELSSEFTRAHREYNALRDNDAWRLGFKEGQERDDFSPAQQIAGAIWGAAITATLIALL